MLSAAKRRRGAGHAATTPVASSTITVNDTMTR
jgi:hypothetical protein